MEFSFQNLAKKIKQLFIFLPIFLKLTILLITAPYNHFHLKLYIYSYALDFLAYQWIKFRET